MFQSMFYYAEVVGMYEDRINSACREIEKVNEDGSITRASKEEVAELRMLLEAEMKKLRVLSEDLEKVGQRVSGVEAELASNLSELEAAHSDGSLLRKENEELRRENETLKRIIASAKDKVLRENDNITGESSRISKLALQLG